jgi:hypothetical protein
MLGTHVASDGRFGGRRERVAGAGRQRSLHDHERPLGSRGSCERHAVEAEQAAIRGAFEDSAKSYQRVLSRIIEADTFRYDG